MSFFKIYVKYQKQGDSYRIGQYTRVQAPDIITAINQVLADPQYNQVIPAVVMKAEQER